MIAEDVKNPIYANEQNTLINCDVKFDEIPEYVPFTASPDDPMDYGRELYAQLQAGQWGPIAPYVPRPISQSQTINSTSTGTGGPNVIA